MKKKKLNNKESNESKRERKAEKKKKGKEKLSEMKNVRWITSFQFSGRNGSYQNEYEAKENRIKL